MLSVLRQKLDVAKIELDDGLSANFFHYPTLPLLKHMSQNPRTAEGTSYTSRKLYVEGERVFEEACDGDYLAELEVSVSDRLVSESSG